VAAEGFSFPIAHFDKTRIEIGRCTISAGEMLFANHGQLKSVLALLGNNGLDSLPIWVTPIYIEMHEGKINLLRVDLLILNRYPIASWGSVDLDKEKVNMIIGITGTALKSAMKFENLDPNYMLQIPFKGPLDNPKIDKKRALTKITSLAASQKGTKGAVIGTVLDIASGGIKENKVPPPTTQPLPWEKK
jgi:hypothetical protein